MPVKLNVGLSKKVGLPAYGSLGASCHVEADVDGSLGETDLEEFRLRVRQAFAACAQAVQEELLRQQNPPSGHPPASAVNGEAAAAPANGAQHARGSSPPRRAGNVRSATQPQLRAIASLARRRNIDLEMLLVERHGNPESTALSVIEASRLIDDLRSGDEGGQLVP